MMKKYNDLGALNIDTSIYQTRISKKFSERKPYAAPNPKLLLSYIPGTVVDIFVTTGQKVKKGDSLMIIDAMKMQNKMKCFIDGKVKSIMVKKGDRVSKGSLLLELE